MKDKIVIFWHRRDLRIEDNTGLYYALNSGYQFLPVFIFDTDILDKLEDKDDARVTFIHERVCQLCELYGKSMRVEIGKPLDVFKRLFEELPIAAIYTNRDYEPYATARDLEVSKLAANYDIEFLDFKDHVIFEKGEILTDAGDPYKVFTPYKRRWLAKFEGLKLMPFDSSKIGNKLAKNYQYKMPELSDIGFKRSDIVLPNAKFDNETIKSYAKQRDYPAVDGTTRLGIHLRHGTISIRKAVKVATSLSEIWLSELIWREFYMMIMAEFPHVVNNAFKPQYDHIPWSNDEEAFLKWCNGETGYPIVDAGMRELNKTGYMHNRVRMITASFLTKHLLIDWRWGEAYFARKLLDFELASNNGGWQWAAGTGTDAQPYFRVFNPTSQMEKFDPDMKYIKKWVPEFGTKDYPKPIVDHKFARERAIQTYKEALA